jgi:spore coat protein SA
MSLNLFRTPTRDKGGAMIFHVLPEVEPFSEQSGGSLSRWAANILRDDTAQIVCPSSDSTWNFRPDRIHRNRGMHVYGVALKKREFRVRTALRVPIMQWLLRGLVSRLTDDDVLYIHNRPEYLLALGRHAHKRARFKVVLHMHNDHLRNLNAQESAALRPDLTVFNSRFLEGLGRCLVPCIGPTAVMYNGADEESFHPAAATVVPITPTILFVGRLVPEKGVHVLLEAMRLLAQQGVRLQAKIIGSVGFGGTGSSPYAEAVRRSCPENTEFIPHMAGDRLAEQFRSASIFCCPSTWEEPFGMVNVEAMASGLPVVASAVGGIPEIFTQGGGLLVRRNSAVELANALKSLVENEPERARLGAQAYSIFQQRFRWSVLYQEYLGLMNSLQTINLYQSSPIAG